jgi:hypothetical protein
MIDHLGEKEKAQILLSEYNSLRMEINERISNAFQVGAIGVATLALCSQLGMATTHVMTVLILGIAGLLWIIFHNFLNAGLRVRELENSLNERAKEKLLVWENELGGLAVTGWWLDFLVMMFKLNSPRRDARD